MVIYFSARLDHDGRKYSLRQRPSDVNVVLQTTRAPKRVTKSKRLGHSEVLGMQNPYRQEPGDVLTWKTPRNIFMPNQMKVPGEITTRDICRFRQRRSHTWTQLRNSRSSPGKSIISSKSHDKLTPNSWWTVASPPGRPEQVDQAR